MTSNDKPQHQWHYFKTTLLNEEELGPVPESEIKRLASAGELKPGTNVMSPTRTKGNWIEVRQVKGLLQLVEQGKSQRQTEKQEKKDSLSAEKKQRKQEIREATSKAVEAASLVDSASHSKIKKQVAQYLTKNESIEFVVMQAKPVAIKADAVVVTNRRLMIVRPKLLGRFEFHDMLWRDLYDAHIKENIIGATFSMRNNKDGSVVTIDMLPKVGARKLYQIAQDREEQAEETRRNRQMEETAAGAAKINVATAAAPTSNGSLDDPMVRLQKLKSMLDAQLISQQDFDQRKAEILSNI